MAQHGSDNSFVNTVQLIYAFGQEGADFYTEDELKYHSGNRGSRGKSYQIPKFLALITQSITPFTIFLNILLNSLHDSLHTFI